MSTLRKASCHCGAVQFQIEFETSLGTLRRCNCSLCSKKGAVMGSVPLNKLTVTSGAEYLSLYEWNTKTAKHYFCKICGIYTHHKRRSNPGEYAFNVACLEGADPTAGAEIELVDGAANSLMDDR